MRDGIPLNLGGTKQRTVLATLLLNRGRVISVSGLAAAVWNDDAPDKPAGTLQVYVSALRKALGGSQLDLQTVAPGYRVTVADGALDVDRFDSARANGQAAALADDPQTASRWYAAALAEWSGSALADLRGLRLADEFAATLEEQRLQVLHSRIDADLACGRDQALIPELLTLTARNPLLEPFWVQLITALYRSGRQSDALSQYRRVSDLLGDELGLDPGPALQRLQNAILRQEPLTVGMSTQPPAALSRTVAESQAGGVAGWLTRADGTTIPIPTRGLRIGRSPDNDLVLDDTKISRAHATLHNLGDHFLLADLHSTNGTIVNDERIEGARRLAAGDRLRFGDAVFTFAHD